MSAQYTSSWCLFHSLRKYCAWRGTLKSITSGSLWFLSIGSTSRKNTVFLLLKLWPPGSNPELMIECKLKAHPTCICTGRSCSELPHCPVIKDQWDCVLHVPEELGNTQLFLKNQYSTGIFSYFLLLLPSILSTYCQTNEESVGTDSEYFL